MNKMLNYMLSIFQYVWVAHWITRAGAKAELHDKLDELYTDLKSFIDEYVETSLSDKSKNIDIVPIKIEVDNISEDMVSEVVNKLIELRQSWIEVKDPILDDLRGRIISRMSHYIFLLNTNTQAFEMFSKKDDELLKELKKRFKSQDDFVNTFKAYIKSSLTDKSLEEFISKNEADLNRLSNAILSTKLQLFSLKESLVNPSEEDKKNFNELVEFFDIFS